MSRLLPAALLLLVAASLPAAAQPLKKADVTIVSSRANQVLFEEAKLDYRRGIKYWASLCDQAGLSYRVAGDYEMETGFGQSAVYVFHHLQRLTATQRKHIEELQARGASVVLVGMTGKEDNKGNAARSLAEQWFELTHVRPYVPEESAYAVALAGTPLAMAVDPGYRFEFEWVGHYTLAQTRFAAMANSEWGLEPFPEKAAGFAGNAAAALRTLNGSRMAWFGVSPDTFVAEKDQVMWGRAMGVLLSWLARKPVVAHCHWQGCRQSATVVTADVEDRFQTGESIALACYKEKVEGSFFLVGSLAPDYPEVVTALAQNGEIGTHSVRHTTFKDRPFDEQVKELEEGKEGLEKLGVKPVIGFRPPMEEYDQNTLHAVAHAGLRFIYGNLDFDRAYPVVREVDGIHIYQFARIVDDDYNLAVVKEVTTATDYHRQYLEEFSRMHALGGLFPFSFHTNYLALEDSLDVIRTAVAHVKREDTWLTTFGRIVTWAETNLKVKAGVAMADDVMVVDVHNGTDRPLQGFSLRVLPPRDVARLEAVDTPSTGLTIGPVGPLGAVLSVDLAPGETKVIKLR